MSDLNELATALAAAQGEIQPAPKDAANPYFKSKYASLPAIREAMQSAFAKHGLSVVQMPRVVEGQLRLSTILLHSSGQFLDCGELAATVEMDNPQKMGSAITYFRRYALAAISQTVADEDDDGNAASHAPIGRGRQPKPTPPPALSEDDQAFVQRATRGINAAKDQTDLDDIGRLIKERPLPERTKKDLRIVWDTRSQLLKQQTEAKQDQLFDASPTSSEGLP